MNNFNTFLGVEQQTWQDQVVEWPLAKSKQQIKEEIWQSIEDNIKNFAKTLIENILEQTIKDYLKLDKYQRSHRKDRTTAMATTNGKCKPSMARLRT